MYIKREADSCSITKLLRADMVRAAWLCIKCYVLVLSLSFPFLAAADPLNSAALGAHAVSASAYELSPVQLPGFNSAEVRALVHYPSDLSEGPYPLVLVLHGNHYTCLVLGETGFLFPTTSFPCPEENAIHNHQGYAYIGEMLASHGIISVSVRSNDLIGGAVDIEVAAHLLQYHLQLWLQFNSVGGEPFGQAFVGKVDLNRIGAIGHSRGGQAVVRQYMLNKQQGEPFNIKGIFLIAPTIDQFHIEDEQPEIVGVPFAVLLPYCDGDVPTLEGISYYDNSRFDGSQGWFPKHMFILMGANHNFFNTIWTPNQYAINGFDDWDRAYPSDQYCTSTIPGNQRLTASEQQLAALTLISAFFKTYLSGDNYFSVLSGASIPSSIEDVSVRTAYQPPATHRLDINRLNSQVSESINALGGVVTYGGLSDYEICGDNVENRYCTGLVGHTEPHTFVTFENPNLLGLAQLKIRWGGDSDGWYRNSIPVEYQDISAFSVLQFRVGTNIEDHSPSFPEPDFEIVLEDSYGNSAGVRVAQISNALDYPPGGSYGVLPRLTLATVALQLDSFAGVDLSHVNAVVFKFSHSNPGAILVADMAFSIDASSNAAPTVMAAPSVMNIVSGGMFSFEIDAVDPESDPLTFALLESPDGMTIDAQTGIIIWIPGQEQIGDHAVTVEASDGSGGAATVSFTIRVRGYEMVFSGATMSTHTLRAWIIDKVCDPTQPIDVFRRWMGAGFGNDWAVDCRTNAHQDVDGDGIVEAGETVAARSVLFRKRDAGGSGWGVTPVTHPMNVAPGVAAIDSDSVAVGGVATGYLVDIMAVTVGAGENFNCNTTLNPPVVSATGAGTVYNEYRCGSANERKVPDAGFSDIEPDKFFGLNTPEGVPGYVASSGVSFTAFGALVYGIPVSVDLRNALQAAQGLAAGAEDMDNMPSLSSMEIRSLFTGGIANWNNLLVTDPVNPSGPKIALATHPAAAALGTVPVDRKVQICRHMNGSGDQAQFNAIFLNWPCGRNVLLPVSAPGNPVLGPVVANNSGSSDVSRCLDDFNQGANTSGKNATLAKRWAIGINSTENNANNAFNYRFIKIDGAAPSLQSVAAGDYYDYAEQSFQYRTNPERLLNASLTSDKTDMLTILNYIAAQGNTPNDTASVNSNYVFTWGQGGWLVTPRSTGGFNPSNPWVATNPVNTSTRAPFGRAPNICQPETIIKAVSVD